MIYIIGVGGVGSRMAPTLCQMAGEKNVTLVDGDKLEPKNLDRQLFSKTDVGANKADALARRYGCRSIPEFYTDTLMSHLPEDWLIGVVDNNPARLAVLRSCDFNGCRAIFGANETHSSEAYVYHPHWKETRLDPRVMYPAINSDHSRDPRARQIGCVAQIDAGNVQLATANLMAAGLACHLYVVWALEAPKMEAETIQYLPHKLVNNLTRQETFRTGVL